MNNLLVDVDGVLLNFQKSFDNWLYEKHHITAAIPITVALSYEAAYDLPWLSMVELIEEFSHTEMFANLSAMDGAQDALRAFHSAGWRISAITACVDTEAVKKSRVANLTTIFGDIFYSIIVVGLGNCKREALSAFSPGVWIDDSVEHSVAGSEIGHCSYWYGGNGEIPHGVTTVWGWNEVVARHLGVEEKRNAA